MRYLTPAAEFALSVLRLKPGEIFHSAESARGRDAAVRGRAARSWRKRPPHGRSLDIARGASVLVPASAPAYHLTGPADALPGPGAGRRPVNVFLIGYRGCGKTEVGRALAAMLQREWVDMDAELAGRLGRSIADHVARSGWASFRQAERRLLQELCGRDGLVVSTGGGVAADRRKRGGDAPQRAGRLAARRSRDHRSADRSGCGLRPASVRRCDPRADPLDEIRTVLESARPPTHRRPTCSIDTDHLSVDEICGRIAAWLATGAMARFGPLAPVLP